MKRSDIEREARKLIGVPWIHQGRNPETGIDCLGVLYVICVNLGVEVEEYTAYKREPDGEMIVTEMNKYFDEIPLLEAREGDILIFRMAGEKYQRHIGILTKGTHEYMLVHSITAHQSGYTVEETLRRWGRLATNAYRFRGLED